MCARPLCQPSLRLILAVGPSAFTCIASFDQLHDLICWDALRTLLALKNNCVKHTWDDLEG